MDNENKVRCFSMYKVLERPLIEFIEMGDGINALPVFEENHYPDSELIDVSMINLVKFISTSFGRCKLPQAYKIVERIHSDNSKKKILRFRSRHPLFVDGSPKYQNICLVSGMVYLGIPILPYFDGEDILPPGDNLDSYLDLLRADNAKLF